jgi:cation-transporting ATPase F
VETLLAKHWHSISEKDVCRFLETDSEQGLDLFEVRRRQQHFGRNIISAKKKRSPFILFLQQFNQSLVYILIIAGLTTMFMQEWVESVFIFGVVIINAIIGFLQEAKAIAAIEALAQSMETEATVIRSGKPETMSAAELVPGDLVELQAGAKVPADIRLLDIRNLLIDESALTGESVPVTKKPELLDSSLQLADRTNMGYASTLVTHGRGKGVVIAIGDKTEIGRISRLISSATELFTPLTRKIAQFSKYLLIAILSMAFLTFVVGLLRGESLFDMFLAAVALAVGAIPEGMPAAITIMLAIGVSRMAKRQAIIRKLPAVETLGGTTVICSDKTGTLTENEMTVEEIATTDNRFTVSGSGYGPNGSINPTAEGQEPERSVALHQCLRCGVLCNDSRLAIKQEHWEVEGDPTEGSLLAAARKGGLDIDSLPRSHPRIDELPFDSTNQFMATLHEDGENKGRMLYVKGALEVVIPRCTNALNSVGEIVAIDMDQVHEMAAEMASRGLRVLAFAQAGPLADHQGIDYLNGSEGLIFLGLQAMMDPPRESSSRSVAICHKAGIRVKMITGDHALTAQTIARKIGILDQEDSGDAVVTGSQLASLSDREMLTVAEKARVFARVTPEQKLRLVEALQEQSEVVAMTGDGVNDAPALRVADIGVAMGDRGTEVAKEASDMVLLDDNFATIVSAIEEGRGVLDNLIKFIVWTLPTNLGEGLVILAAIFAGVTLPILPIQILWINMTTAILLGLMLVFERREANIMERPPRDPQLPIITGDMVVRILYVGVLMLIGGFGLFELAEIRGLEIDEARTIAVNVFVFIEIFYLFNSRSLHYSVKRIGFFSNLWVFGGVTTMIVLQLLFTYLPAANKIFQSAPIGLLDWLKILLFSLLVFIIVEVEKAIRLKKATRLVSCQAFRCSKIACQFWFPAHQSSKVGYIALLCALLHALRETKITAQFLNI